MRWGLAHGIRRFQGRHVDAMLAVGRIEACPHAAACTLRQCMDREGAATLAGRAGCRNAALLDAGCATDTGGAERMSEAAVGLDALSALVRESAVSGVERRALLFRTDVLPPALARPHHLRLVRDALDTLGLADRARRHELPNGRMAVSWRGESPALLQEAMDALDTLLQDAPLEAPGLPELISLYALPAEGAALLRDAGADTSQAARSGPAFAATARTGGSPAAGARLGVRWSGSRNGWARPI